MLRFVAFSVKGLRGNCMPCVNCIDDVCQGKCSFIQDKDQWSKDLMRDVHCLKLTMAVLSRNKVTFSELDSDDPRKWGIRRGMNKLRTAIDGYRVSIEVALWQHYQAVPYYYHKSRQFD